MKKQYAFRYGQTQQNAKTPVGAEKVVNHKTGNIAAGQEDDDALMRRIAEGEEKAYALLVQKHLGRTVRMAMRILSNQADAEDAAQDAFIRVWKHAPNWEPESRGGAKFTTWFYRVVTNLCIDYTRKKRGLALDDLPEAAAETESSLEYLERNEMDNMVKTLINTLPERQRTALTLCFYEEFSNQEAAEIMGIGIKALESLLVRARKHLREHLDADEIRQSIKQK